MVINKQRLIRDIISMGVEPGDILNVKASLKSIGRIESGAKALLEALLEVVGKDGTIIVDSFVSVRTPFSRAYWQNIVDAETPSYAGALANAVVQHPNSYRSSHPVQKFAAIGKHAKRLTKNHTADSYAYGVLNEIASLGGKNLKIGADEKVPGVGTSHVAIGLANIRQRRPLVGVRYVEKSKTRNFMVNWSGGCTLSFYQLNKLYDQHPGAIIKRGLIGAAPSKISSMKKTLSIELDLIGRDKNKFLKCGDPDCVDCLFSWEHCEEVLWDSVLRFLKTRRPKLALKSVVTRYFYRFPF